MSVVPDTTIGKIEFAEDHVAPFTANAVAIGTTSAAVTAWTAKVTAAREKYQARAAAQNAAKAATADLGLAMDALNNATADIIKQIRTQAALTGDGVYVLAEIPAPAGPSPVGAPGTPFEFKVELLPNGTIEMGWKCTNPPGCNNVIYQIYRKVELTGAYEYVGGAGSRKFVDTTVPAGVPSVMYQIVGTRSTAVGIAAEFVVNFGVTPGAPVVTTAAVAGTGIGAKIAA